MYRDPQDDDAHEAQAIARHDGQVAALVAVAHPADEDADAGGKDVGRRGQGLGLDGRVAQVLDHGRQRVRERVRGHGAAPPEEHHHEVRLAVPGRGRHVGPAEGVGGRVGAGGVLHPELGVLELLGAEPL